VRPTIEVNISWLLNHLEKENGKAKFAIDRKTPSCHTPRRNTDIDGALDFFRSANSWSERV